MTDYSIILDKNKKRCYIGKGTKGNWYHRISRHSVTRVLRHLVTMHQQGRIDYYYGSDNWVSFTVRDREDKI